MTRMEFMDIEVVIRKLPGRTLFKIGVVYSAPDPSADACMAGLFGELKIWVLSRARICRCARRTPREKS
jgi:hypothetical protein